MSLLKTKLRAKKYPKLKYVDTDPIVRKMADYLHRFSTFEDRRFDSDFVEKIQQIDSDFLIKSHIKWNLNSVKEEALKYKTRNEFAVGSSSAYQWAYSNGALDEVCKHMKEVRICWDLELVKKEALKYKTRNEFKNGSQSAYSWARRNGVLGEVCKHMKSHLLDLELVRKEALKYKTRSEFAVGSSGAYQWAIRNGVLDEVCKHMKSKDKYFR